jgi:Sec-independent protein secretion pathway component TatC
MQAPLPAATHRVRVVLSSLSALFLVLLAFPANLQSVLLGGASARPVVSLFMTWVSNQVLPPGWVLLSGGNVDPLLLYVEASLALTLIIGYPLIAFVLFERIVRSGGGRRRRMVYALTSLSSAAFFGGVLFGLFFMIKFYILSLPPYFGAAAVFGSGSFYVAGLGVVSILALVSTLPFVLLGVSRFRTSEPLRIT